MPMKLWLLERDDPGSDVLCDCVNAMLVRAKSAPAARRLAASCARDEGRDTWLSPSKSSCRLFPVDGFLEHVVIQETRDC